MKFWGIVGEDIREKLNNEKKQSMKQLDYDRTGECF